MVGSMAREGRWREMGARGRLGCGFRVVDDDDDGRVSSQEDHVGGW